MGSESYNFFDQLCFFADYCNTNSAETLSLNEQCGIAFENIEDDMYLNDFRNRYRLNKYVKNTDEDTVRNILRWVFEMLLNHVYVENTISYTSSTDMIQNARQNRINLNCYCHAYILRDALQCVGIVARLIYCLPLNCDYFGNHVVVEFFDRCKKQWIMVDPTYNILFSDCSGNLLNLISFRKKIIKQEDIVIIDNNRFSALTKNSDELFLRYLEMIVPLLIVLQYESVSEKRIKYYRLIPEKYMLPQQQINGDITYLNSYNNLYYT